MYWHMTLVTDREILCEEVPAFKAFCFVRQVTENVWGKQEIDYVSSNIQNESIGSSRIFDAFIISLEFCTIKDFEKMPYWQN